MKKKQEQLSGMIQGIFVALGILGIAFILLVIWWKPKAQREDYERIASTEYDTVFLSMYPLDTYREEDYSYFRGMTIMIASCCMPRFSMIEDYMQEIAKSGNIVTTVYLGIRPDRTDPEEVRALIERYPGMTFEIILSHPAAYYWRSLSQEKYEETLAAYCSFLSAVPDIAGANFYFMSCEEWLICNPSNYIDEWLLTESAATVVMTHSDTGHDYLVKDVDAAIWSLREVTGRLRLEQKQYPDLSETCVLFFGDSVIANYTDNMSIPGVVNSLTGASVYNFGYGGNSAVLESADKIALPGILDAFFRKDLSVLPQGEQVYQGIASYLENPPEGKKLCFVINYGLNDYFKGYALSSEDPYDEHTFCGAIRTAVRTIRENAPEAQIILCTPNFIADCDAGTEPHGSEGNTLSDYVRAEIELSQELDVDLLDNYHELDITIDNNRRYLEDKIHPSLACRYLMGERLCGAIH